VTQVYDHGFLPKGREELGKNVKDGESAQKLDREGFLKHLQEFRDRMKVPFASVVAEKADFASYKVRGIPTMVVVDAAGKVRFIAVGGKRESLLRIAIERCLDEAK
jgi:hypothetical protein